MQISEKLLKELQNRLKTGNRRGVHLNAIPGRSRYKVDLSRLADISENLPTEFISTLLDEKSFKFPVTWRGNITDLHNYPEEKQVRLVKLSRAINNLINQVNAIESEKGTNTFGFGYPILLRKDKSDGKLVAAPILIWSLHIKRSRESETWVIERKEDDPVYFNEVLKNHLWADSQVILQGISEEMIDDGFIDKKELARICTNLLEDINSDIEDETLSKIFRDLSAVNKIKDKKYYEEFSKLFSNAWIHYGGLLSIFEVQKQSIIEDYEDLFQLSDDWNISNENWKEHQFQSLSSVRTDPSQQGLLNALQTDKNLLIQGPPGTGKSQTLTAILVNALENGKTSLVVCEKRTALEVLQNSLSERGLSEFCLLVKDSVKDRRKAVDSVRERTDGYALKNVDCRHSQNALNQIVKRCNSLIENINVGHEKTGRKLIGHKNWTKVVGELLQEKTHSREDIRLRISKSIFSFEENELSGILDFLDKAQDLYNRCQAENPVLFWQPRRFTGDNPYSLIAELEDDIYDLQEKAGQLKGKIADFRNEYYSLRIRRFQKDVANFKQQATNVYKITDRYNGDSDFFNQTKTAGFLYRFLANFSSKKKMVLSDQATILTLFRQLHFTCENSEFLPVTFDSDNIKNSLLKLKQTEMQVGNKNEAIEKQLKAEVRELNPLRRSQVLQVKAHDEIIEIFDFIKAKALKDDWLVDKFDFKEDESFVRDTDSLISKLAGGLDKNDAFFAAFAWFSFYNTFNEKQKMIYAGVKSRKNWRKSFKKYYLNCLLEKNADNTLPVNDEELKKLEKSMRDLPEAQIAYIKEHWYARQETLRSQYDSAHEVQVVNLYNKRKSNRHSRLSLRRIVKEDTELFTTFFPVILITPDECSKLFRGYRDYFDIVLFDEASQLRLEDTLPALLKGKQRIIAGDEHQMPPSNYFSKIFDGANEDDNDEEEEDDTPIRRDDFLLDCESLLQFGEQLNFEKKYLDFHYRSRHPYLIEFSNQAFYNGRLVSLPITEDYTPITFIDVAGEYSDNMNDAEAETVLSILEHNIKMREDGTYPSVGVATFNLKQRDLITQKITERRQHTEYNRFSEKIEVLEKNENGSLFIKNLENIQGDERDVIILSTTYGKNKEGRFFNRFGSIGQAKGYKLLNVIVTRAKYKIYVCCSVPPIDYLNYKTHLIGGGNNRRGAFFAYLAYARYVSENNEEQRRAVLSALAENSSKKTTLTREEYGATESPFEEEVYQMLKERFEKENLKLQYKFSGFRIDIVYDTLIPGAPKIAIECDGAKYHSGREAYLHDTHRQNILEKNGFIFHRIWSTSWWQNSSREFEKLADFIEKERTRIARMNLTENNLDEFFTTDVKLSSRKRLNLFDV